MLIVNNATINPNFYEYLSQGAFDLVKDEMLSYSKAGTLKDSIGRKDLTPPIFKKLNNYNYLLIYCMLIKIYIVERINNGLEVTWDDINDRYKLDDLVANGGCLGIKVQKVLDYFGYNKSLNSPGGINYDTIQRNSTLIQPLDIRQTIPNNIIE